MPNTAQYSCCSPVRAFENKSDRRTGCRTLGSGPAIQLQEPHWKPKTENNTDLTVSLFVCLFEVLELFPAYKVILAPSDCLQLHQTCATTIMRSRDNK